MDHTSAPYKIINELKIQLRKLDGINYDKIERIEKVLGLCSLALTDLHQFINENEFKSKEEEIEFFKSIKPIALSEYLYFSFLLEIENKLPFSSIKAQIKYLQNQIQQSQQFFMENNEFYIYFRKNSKHLDDNYFARTNSINCINPYHYVIDLTFSTSHYYTLAAIKANQKIIDFCKSDITRLTSNKKGLSPINAIANKTNLDWTESKTALVELIYALQSSGAINNGKSDIIELIKVFETIFYTKFTDFYHTFIEIRLRKTGRTKFLDSLRHSLIKRMDDADK